MLAYLSGPIDAHSDKPVDRALALEALRREGFDAYDPSTAFTFAGDPRRSAGAVYRINEIARQAACAHLALWPEGASSIGTPMEIQSSWQEKQPVAVCGGIESVQLAGMGVQRFLYEDVGLAAAWLAESVRQRDIDINTELAREFGLSAREMGLATRNGYVLGPTSRTIKWTDESGGNVPEPCAGRAGDAGFDLYVVEDVTIPFNSFVDVPCGISIELPPGVWAMITGRSSTIRKRKLLVNTGIIDNGYRGPLFAAVWNMSDKAVKVKAGERLAQLIPFPLTAEGLKWEWVEALNESERGTAGFGSTGA